MSAVLATSLIHSGDLIAVLYIISFSLFIYGLSGLTGPRCSSITTVTLVRCVNIFTPTTSF